MQLGWACRPIRNCSPALYSNGKVWGCRQLLLAPERVLKATLHFTTAACSSHYRSGSAQPVTETLAFLQRLSALSTAAQARKHAQRSKAPAITVEDDAPQVALADVGRLQDLAKVTR